MKKTVALLAVLAVFFSFAVVSASAEGVNIALNMPYEAPEGRDEYTANLTDGLVEEAVLYDDSWYAFYWRNDTGNAVNGVGTVVIDLGKVSDGIYSFRGHFAAAKGSGILPPTSVDVSVSSDGSAWTDVGGFVIETIKDDSSAWLGLTLERGVSARYVKFIFTLDTTVGHCFINELEIYADDSTSAGDISEAGETSEPDSVSDASEAGGASDISETADVSDISETADVSDISAADESSAAVSDASDESSSESEGSEKGNSGAVIWIIAGVAAALLVAAIIVIALKGKKK